MRRIEKLRILQVDGPRGGLLSLGLAERFWPRLAGLAGLSGLPPGTVPVDGIVIPRCRSVHTVGMRFAIDVVFVSWPPDRDGRLSVVSVRERLDPLRVAIAPGRAQAVAAIELGVGQARSRSIVAGAAVRVTSAAGSVWQLQRLRDMH